MAYLNPPLRFRVPSGPRERLRFQRGLEKAPVKKIQRKLTVRFKHIFLFFFLLAAIFYSVTKFYLFLITWDDLNVRKTLIVCQRDFVAADIRAWLDASRLGNLLLLDIAGLQDRIERHRWVKEARLRKVFPSSLKIEIRERQPAAVLRIGESYLLIDEEGAVLERYSTPVETSLPLLVDSSGLRTGYREKLDLVWNCLASLTAEEKAGIEAVDISRTDSVGLYLKSTPTRLLLGEDGFAEKFRYYFSNKEQLEGQFGILEYVDLRFRGKIYLKPLEPREAAALANSAGEGE
jgi:cell division septal protein FtsQ